MLSKKRAHFILSFILGAISTIGFSPSAKASSQPSEMKQEIGRETAREIASKIKPNECRKSVLKLLDHSNSNRIEIFSPIRDAWLSNGLFGKDLDERKIRDRAESLEPDEIDVIFGPTEGRASFDWKGALFYKDFGRAEFEKSPWGTPFQTLGFRMRLPKDKLDALKNKKIILNADFFKDASNVRAFLVNFPSEVMPREEIKNRYSVAVGKIIGLGIFSLAPWIISYFKKDALEFSQTLLLTMASLYFMTKAKIDASEIKRARDEIQEQDTNLKVDPTLLDGHHQE